jgi:hypothetical protein
MDKLKYEECMEYLLGTLNGYVIHRLWHAPMENVTGRGTMKARKNMLKEFDIIITLMHLTLNATGKVLEQRTGVAHHSAYDIIRNTIENVCQSFWEFN